MMPSDADAGADTSSVGNLGERALIQRIITRLAPQPWLIVGPGDDAAVIEPERGSLEVITTDALVEGVHFDRGFCSPEAIGHKALAVNLSDLAAMGASPRAALLSLMLPDALLVADLDAMLDGLLGLAGRHKTSFIGGNVTRSPGPLVLDVTALGSVGRRRALTRSGARPGDEVYVTGSLGLGVVGLAALHARENVPQAEQRYLKPDPRVRAGVLLGRNRAASACMDLSDGLADSVRQVAEASGVGMAIETAALPIDGAVVRWFEQRRADPVIAAVAGGDDYELLFTSRPAQRGRLRAVRRLLGNLPITRIGVVTKERNLVLKTPAGARELPEGFRHFR
jgi:thiamine-monophosphate kinase